MKKSFFILFMLLLNIGNSLFSQVTVPEEEGIKNSVFVKNNTETIRAELINFDAKAPRIRSDRYYYWFKSQKIFHTQGGFGGRLLDGNYSAYFPDNNLKEKGHFRYGLKVGKWQTWYINGQLMEESIWKNGLRKGKYLKLNTDNKTELKGKYKNGKFYGQSFGYRDSLIEITTIKAGVAGKTIVKGNKYSKDSSDKDSLSLANSGDMENKTKPKAEEAKDKQATSNDKNKEKIKKESSFDPGQSAPKNDVKPKTGKQADTNTNNQKQWSTQSQSNPTKNANINPTSKKEDSKTALKFFQKIKNIFSSKRRNKQKNNIQ